MKTMINWFTVPCTDFDRSVTFYNTIFEVEMPRMTDPAGNDMATFFDPSEGLAGAINSDPSLSPSDKGPRIYLNANGQLDDILDRVGPAGGEIVQAKMTVPQWGQVALIRDPEGNFIGLHSS